MASTHLPSLTKQVQDSHSPIPSQAVPSQPLYPTHLQHSPGSFSSHWSPSPGCSLSAPSCCASHSNWGAGSQGRRWGWCCWGSCCKTHLPKGTCTSSLSMSQGLTCPGGLSSCHTTCGLCRHNFHLHISHRLRCGNQEVYFCLRFHFTLFHLTTCTDITIVWHKDIISLCLHATKRLQLSWGPDSFSAFITII